MVLSFLRCSLAISWCIACVFPNRLRQLVEAVCAGAWIEGRAAALYGTGLMATDLFDRIPLVLREIA